MLSRVARSLIRAYQLIVSPFLHALTGSGSGCRFEPTCSQYGLECYREHSALRATGLTLGRILRCHPWSVGGQDPVPRAIGTEIQKREGGGAKRSPPLSC